VPAETPQMSEKQNPGFAGLVTIGGMF